MVPTQEPTQWYKRQQQQRQLNLMRIERPTKARKSAKHFEVKFSLVALKLFFIDRHYT